ncbi:uncharacterized protein LOC119609333 [Lucilia sericata]|uniref:uncharacterized protein LOC119609331 n=1 Tax=Lucilia sericata TaxID=13632 RepID=UPI0018A7F775|nr:uncharacterized protein LOC119609331 [Lucilia sericata]XP_037820000.1 uncharacterized protein LOC119609332 [Lucilia sericata]XP_037820001.1 uncharacterized protein LOC119609333 [Lucilia sericata]
MKLYILILITAVVLICSKSVAGNGQDHEKDSDHDFSDALNSNSIYRNDKQATVHTKHDKLGPFHKDTVVVKDANGNVQESTKVYRSGSSKLDLNIGICSILLFAGFMNKYY